MKDNGEDHFDFVHHNVSACKMNVGKLECTKFGKVGLNNHVSLSHSQKLANGSPMIKDSYEKNIWVSPYLELCITCARTVNFIQIRFGSF